MITIRRIFGHRAWLSPFATAMVLTPFVVIALASGASWIQIFEVIGGILLGAGCLAIFIGGVVLFVWIARKPRKSRYDYR